jgi:hypothetical protein
VLEFNPLEVAFEFTNLGGEESKAKNSKVAHENAERKEHGEFILVRASGK